MAFFKFRKGSDDVAPPPAVPESVEAMRKRAKQRLIGAVVLVLIGVVGFPLLVDNQPRPIAVDIPISIPDRNKVAPLPAPVQQATGTVVQAPPTPVQPSPTPSPTASSAASPAAAPSVSATTVAAQAVAAPAVAAPVATPQVAKDQAKSGTSSQETRKPELDSGARAQALLEGGSPSAVASSAPAQANAPSPPTPVAGPGERYIVQFGAYADAAKAREARLKVEAAGLKTYAQVIETAEGKRYRVRVGPYVSKAEAEKAAEKIKKLDLQAAILTIPS